MVQREQPPVELPDDFDVPPGHAVRMKVTYKPIDAPNDILEPQFPLQLGPIGGIPEGHCLITIACQNQGTGLDQNVKMDINFKSGAIVNYRLSNTERVKLINGGSRGAWSASFTIANLLPGEYRSAVVSARDEPFQVKVWSQNSSRKVAIYQFEVVFGDFEAVPIENSPYAND